MPLDPSARIDLLRDVLAIRRFEESVKVQLKEGLIPGTVHLSIGHEGAIAGACAALDDDDHVVGSHRSHGHPIAKGADLGRLMAELMGREGGVCRGRGGSMHLTDHSVGVVGESGIVGGGLPIATGVGLSAKVLGNGRVCLCFFGDGACNEGAFHESLNLAAIWKLPVVFLCENNLYGARRARRGEGPSLVEAKTYRFGEHAEGIVIPVSYRDAAEVEQWKDRDPLEILRARLSEEGILAEGAFEALASEVQQRIDAAVASAEASPPPDPSAAFEDVYSNPIEGGGR